MKDQEEVAAMKDEEECWAIYDHIEQQLISITDGAYPYMDLSNWTSEGRGRNLDPVLRPERAEETQGIVEYDGCFTFSERCVSESWKFGERTHHVKEDSMFYDMGCGALNTVVFNAAACGAASVGAEINPGFYGVAQRLLEWAETEYPDSRATLLPRGDMFDVNLRNLCAGKPVIIYACNKKWGRLEGKLLSYLAKQDVGTSLYLASGRTRGGACSCGGSSEKGENGVLTLTGDGGRRP
eukprot:COSAG05_NODE_934_length_6536_cov_9.161100_2_plen_239_part_00